MMLPAQADVPICWASLWNSVIWRRALCSSVSHFIQLPFLSSSSSISYLLLHPLPLLLIFHFIVFHSSLSSSIPSFSLCLLCSSSLLFFPVLSSLFYLSLIFLFIISMISKNCIFICQIWQICLQRKLITTNYELLKIKHKCLIFSRPSMRIWCDYFQTQLDALPNIIMQSHRSALREPPLGSMDVRQLPPTRSTTSRRPSTPTRSRKSRDSNSPTTGNGGGND